MAMLGRIVVTVLLHSSSILANGIWDVVLFVVSVAIAIAAGGVGPLARRLRRQANG